MRMAIGRRRVVAVVTAGVVAVVAGLSACSSSGSADVSTVRIVACSAPEPAYDALQAAFAKTAAGKSVKSPARTTSAAARATR